MPIYLLNTAFNMIEVVDNNTGETIGNALCYFAKNYDGEMAFVIDNIEIRNSKKFFGTNAIHLRDTIIDYANNIAKEVTNNPNPKIYLGTAYNDLPTNDLHLINTALEFIGTISANYTYSDVFYGDVYDGCNARVDVYDVSHK